MSRVDRWLFAILGIAALLIGVNLVAAASGWVGVWQGLSHLDLRATQVVVAPERDSIVVEVTVRNGSERSVRVLLINSEVDLNGHQVALGRTALSDFVVAGDSERSLKVVSDVGPTNRAALDEQLAASATDWQMSGQIQVEIAGLSHTRTTVPYELVAPRP